MIYADLRFEKKLWQGGYQLVAGIDEVGRGSWAGPVVAAAVIFSAGFKLTFKVTDSKLLSKKDREGLSDLIRDSALAVGIAEIGLPIVDRIGVGRASQVAFRQAIKNLKVSPDYFLIDAFYIKHLAKNRQLPIKKGDQKSASIAAASIVAKVYRDKVMEELGRQFPHYGFEIHKGYGTKAHQRAIAQYGFCSLHRMSFNLGKWSSNSVVS